ncbi:hypothetical protein BY996DRAFT_4600920 [Phakopsora pachyrhizi]|nr:hypothetical protein BY996DRAFT_4600920 [Phakopsora pachyrhizi]
MSHLSHPWRDQFYRLWITLWLHNFLLLSARSSISTICTPQACLNSSQKGFSVGASAGDPSITFLPGVYSSLQDSTTTILRPQPGFEASQHSDLAVTQSASLIAYSSPYYHLDPRPIERLGNLTGTIRSFLIATGYLAVLGSEDDSQMTLTESCADIRQITGVGEIKSLSVESSNCPGGCGVGGRCNIQSKCDCAPGFSGSRCDSCAPGYFGRDCQACPNDCGKNVGTLCDDGITGSGSCFSPNSNLTINPNPVSQISELRCNCINGICTSSTSCSCSAGWKSASDGKLCASCQTGFYLNALGECSACSPGCRSCTSPIGICQDCVGGFINSGNDPTTCVPAALDLVGGNGTTGACREGFFNSQNSTCAPCDSGCKACSGASSSSCTQCPQKKALLTAAVVGGNSNLTGVCVDFDPGSGVCSTPESLGLFLFNQTKGLCDSAPRLCSAATIPGFSIIQSGSSTANNFQTCTSCVEGALLLPNLRGEIVQDARCVGVCPNGTYNNHQGQCYSCPIGCSNCFLPENIPTQKPQCLACSDATMFIQNGDCVKGCRPGTFAGTSLSDSPWSLKGSPVCFNCSSSCQTCSNSPTRCQSCPKARPALDPSTQTCSLACPKGSFADSSSGGRCSLCDSSCSTCHGPDFKSCLSCKEGKSLRNGRCEDSLCSGFNSSLFVMDWGICLGDLIAEVENYHKRLLPSWIVGVVTAILVLLLLAVSLSIWRYCQRRRRQKKTDRFKNELANADIKLDQIARPISYSESRRSWSTRPISSLASANSHANLDRSLSTDKFKIKRKSVSPEARLEALRYETQTANSTNCSVQHEFQTPNLHILEHYYPEKNKSFEEENNEGFKRVSSSVWFKGKHT